jgi:hypothetical protein
MRGTLVLTQQQSASASDLEEHTDGRQDDGEDLKESSVSVHSRKYSAKVSIVVGSLRHTILQISLQHGNVSNHPIRLEPQQDHGK